MKKEHLRIFAIVTVVVVLCIISIQITWLTKLYTFEKKEFNLRSVKAIGAISDHFGFSNGGELNEFVERPDENTYLIKTDSIPVEQDLREIISYSLENEELYIDCRFGVYKSDMGDYAFQSYIKSPGSIILKKNRSAIELFTRDYDYLYINFPNRDRYLLSKMDRWLISTAILISALIGLLILLIYFLRQRTMLSFQKDFVNNLIHEFKTPLAVMKIAGDVLNKENIKEQPERLQRYASIISNQTDHLQTQVHRLLEMTTQDRKKLELNRDNIQLNEFVQQALSKLQPLIEEKDAKLDLELPEESVCLVADQAHLELAFINLVENSLKYSVRPHIIISAGIEGRDCFISVKDNGIGIEKKYLKDIFTRFYRVPTGNIQQAKGFGLGLNFVKKVVDAHRGRITVNSMPGIGTEIKIYIPS